MANIQSKLTQQDIAVDRNTTFYVYPYKYRTRLNRFELFGWNAKRSFTITKMDKRKSYNIVELPLSCGNGAFCSISSRSKTM
jgi:hypothetical protein